MARTRRRVDVAPKAPMGFDDRRADEDDEPPIDEIDSCSDISSLESDTSDTSLTARRGRLLLEKDPASSRKQPYR